tara:strand:+ start:138 stop:407 length:270 start_codon:yes stop_codon:yes gene_type:complete
MNNIWKIWKYALGSFSDEKTKDVDNTVVVVRSAILASYLITNCFIISGVIRHWNYDNTQLATPQQEATKNQEESKNGTGRQEAYLYLSQ